MIYYNLVLSNTRPVWFQFKSHGRENSTKFFCTASYLDVKNISESVDLRLPKYSRIIQDIYQQVGFLISISSRPVQ